MNEKIFFRLICIDENDPFEYKVLADENKGTLDDVHNFVVENYEKYKNARWILLPGSVNI